MKKQLRDFWISEVEIMKLCVWGNLLKADLWSIKAIVVSRCLCSQEVPFYVGAPWPLTHNSTLMNSEGLLYLCLCCCMIEIVLIQNTNEINHKVCSETLSLIDVIFYWFYVHMMMYCIGLHTYCTGSCLCALGLCISTLFPKEVEFGCQLM